MLLRKLLVVVGPLLLCLITCTLFKWLDALLTTGDFFLYMLKGVTLGVCVALMLPVAGLSLRGTGLTQWMYAAAGLLLLTLLYQYLETLHVVDWPALRAMISINGQVVLVESTVMGYLTLTAVFNRRAQG